MCQIAGMVYEPPVHEEIYTCLVNTVYLEFIPEECIEENNPKTLFIEQVGQKYKMIFDISVSLICRVWIYCYCKML